MGKKREPSMEYMEDISIDLPTRIERWRRALTVTDLAEITSISDKQIYSLIKRGLTLPAQNVSLSELLKWRKGNANEEWEAGQVHA
jgi:predicted DNA-binding transcriptional regulator AlpA